MLHSECSSTLELIDSELAEKLVGIVRGIEKEGLRVDVLAAIAQSAHPEALGSTLTHSSITTDYSEALLEFITPAQKNIDDAVNYLANLHRFTLKNIGDETIWPASMPCLLKGDASIPIADYGSSNVGMLKHVYRQGLAVRYGRIMQSIAGIHYNFSLPEDFWSEYQTRFYQANPQEHQSLQDFKSKHYFSLIRNFRRYSWILHFLFGASPVVDESFLDGRPESEHGLQKLGDRTWGLPYSTSLRMSDLGYQNSAQEALHVSYDSLEDYVATLSEAIYQPYQAYADAGVKSGDKYQQLNTNILQIENEYYSDIRPKRVTRSGEKPVAALRDRGVEYIEVRILDINPFIPEGISAQQMRFMDAFMLYCLLSQCPEQSNTGCQETRGNQTKVIADGRNPDLQLERMGESVPMTQMAIELLDDVMDIAKVLDQATDSFEYTAAVYAQQAKVEDPRLTPSGQLMARIESGEEFIDLAHDLAKQHKTHYSSMQQDQDLEDALLEEAVASIAKQKEMEQSDKVSFAEFLDSYNNS